MEKELWKGNEAVAEAAIRAGCKLFFGYPITPQNEIPEYLAQHLPKIGGCFLQAESEVAAINMVYGAAGCGKRVMTSSSSPESRSSRRASPTCAARSFLRHRQHDARRPRPRHHPAGAGRLLSGHPRRRQR